MKFDPINIEIIMVVASRSIEIRKDQTIRSIEIRVHAPECLGDHWTCKYDIGWPEGGRSSFAAGIDAVQALYLALQKIGIDLYRSSYHAAGELVWKAPGEGYGFPVPKNGRDVLIGFDKEFDG